MILTLLALYIGQAINYLIVVINMRAIAKGRLPIALVTEFLFCVVNFYMIRMIGEATTFYGVLAYAAGGTTGTLGALLLTRKWDSHA